LFGDVGGHAIILPDEIRKSLPDRLSGRNARIFGGRYIRIYGKSVNPIIWAGKATSRAKVPRPPEVGQAFQPDSAVGPLAPRQIPARKFARESVSPMSPIPSFPRLTGRVSAISSPVPTAVRLESLTY
jgi:hypothetical protein